MAMGQMISPGVYTRIIDLSEYLADVPGTIGFVPILSKRGPDNKLMFVASKEQFISTYGQPNIVDYGKYFGQGPYVAWQHLGVSSNLYVLRALPNDATYAHLFIGMQLQDYILNTTYSSSAQGFPFTRLTMHPMYMDGQVHSYNGAINYTVDGAGHISAVSVNNAGYGYAPGNYTLDDSNQQDFFPTGVGGAIKYHVKLDGTIGAETIGQISYPAVQIIDAGTNYPPGNHVYTLVNNPWRSINHVQELETQLQEEDVSTWLNLPATGGTGVPYGFLMYFRGLGRGGSYNDFSIRLSRKSNPELFGTYTLDIYEKQADGDSIITESYNVSFDPNQTDDAGESMFIEDVVNKFSQNIRCNVSTEALRQLEQYKMDFYKNDPTLPEWVTQYTVLDQNDLPTDLGFKATMIEFAKLDYDYANAILTQALDALTVARAKPTTTQAEIIARNEAVSLALVELSAARAGLDTAQADLDVAYNLDIMDFGDADLSQSGTQPWPLSEGSEGSLLYVDTTTGKEKVHKETATQILVEAYLGLLLKPDNPPKEDPTSGRQIWKEQFVDEVFDLDWIYFSLVYDAGYGNDIKNAAETLAAIYRMDCMLISDCGDNIDLEDVQQAIGMDPAYNGGKVMNTKYAARYESYSRIYDVFTGRDLWISPVYHMAQLIPLNDRLYEIWYASAGFNRGTLDSIKELRWSPKLGERDKLYLWQVNPIVHFPEGYTVWGNLTTQKRPTALQDVNVMRLVLYIKRALEQYCRYFIFELNDEITHEQIKKGILPFLDTIKARRGLVDYSVDVGATEWEFKNKICHVDVTLTPMKVIEKIELNLYIK